MFTSSVIIEALRALTDESCPIPEPIMRTALIAAQSHVEVRRFIVSDLIPILAKRKAWETAPRVWDGVVRGIRLYANLSCSEPTLRSILGVPGKVLRAVVDGTAQEREVITGLLKKYLATLTSADRIVCLLGQQSVPGDANATVHAELDLELDTDKMEIVHRIESSK